MTRFKQFMTPEFMPKLQEEIAQIHSEAAKNGTTLTRLATANALKKSHPDVSTGTLEEWVTVVRNASQKVIDAYVAGKITYYMLRELAAGQIDVGAADILYDHAMERKLKPSQVGDIRAYMKAKKCLVDEAVKVVLGEIEKHPNGKKPADLASIVADIDRCVTKFQALAITANDIAPMSITGPTQDKVRIYEAAVVFRQAAGRALENASRICDRYLKEIEKYRDEKLGSDLTPLLTEEKT